MIAPRIHTASDCGGIDHARELDELFREWTEASNVAEAHGWPPERVALADEKWATYSQRKMAYAGGGEYSSNGVRVAWRN